MKFTLQDRLLRRDLGCTSRYSSIKGIYGDKNWVDELDIVNELGGHSGCVNALRYTVHFYCPATLTDQIDIGSTAGLHQEDFWHPAAMTSISISILINLIHRLHLSP